LRTPIVGIGCDAPQELAAEILKFSIQSHSRANVEVVKLNDTARSAKIAPAQWNGQRTPFSFQRFLLAKFMLDYGADVAVYLDSDMLMLRAIEELVALFGETGAPIATAAPMESWRRRRQSSVMVMDRAGAAQLWTSFENHVADGLSYDDLIYLRTIGPIGTLPYQWNCMEYLDHQTALIHYTDMDAQPWLWDGNPNAGIWYTYLCRFAGEPGGRALVEREIARGHVRPALAAIIANGPSISATSTVAHFRDLLFVPPHRFRSIRGAFVRKLLAPALRGAIHMQFVVTNGQPNTR
jgi:hypothetical protein